MKITKYDNAGILVETESGTLVVVDLAKDVPEVDVAEVAARSPHAALVSHLHGDHLHLPHLLQLGVPVHAPVDVVERIGSAVTTHVVDVGDEFPVGDLLVTAHEVDHGEISFPIVNLAFVLAADRRRVWFAGDIAADTTPHPEGLFDVVLVPVGGGKVFSPDAAVAYAASFEGAIVVPMHTDHSLAAALEFDGAARAAGLDVVLLGNRETFVVRASAAVA